MKKVDYLKQWKKEHPEQCRKYDKKYYEAHKELIRERAKGYNKKYCETHKEQRRRYQKQYVKEHRGQARQAVFEKLGNKCSNPNCAVIGGMTDVRALQIDHINGGGTKEIRSFTNSTNYCKFVLKQINTGSKKYQLLCANCNWIKRHENNENHPKNLLELAEACKKPVKRKRMRRWKAKLKSD